MAYLKRKKSSASIRLAPAGAPSSAAEGQVYFDSTTKVAYAYAGGFWNQMNAQFLGAGGTISTYADGGTTYILHTYLESGIFQAVAGDVDYLVVAGGGGVGGATGSGSGGGGAGGFRTAAAYSITAASHAITVGAGGTGGRVGSSSVRGTVGGNSSIGSLIISTGGGDGTPAYQNSLTAGAGGSGGGAGAGNAATIAGGLASPAGQGNAGGAHVQGSFPFGAGAGGSGGGAGGVGLPPNTEHGGRDGGVGLNQIMGLSAADSNTLLTSISAGHSSGGTRYFAGGGASGSSAAPMGDGGLGGGGGGATAGARSDAVAGTPNTGGGASGVYGILGVPAIGGSGIVIIRYAV
jgi:hypothetical protein